MTMFDSSEINKLFSHLNPLLRKEMIEDGIVQEIPQDTEVLREGQYVKVIPFVLSGLIKVFTRHEEKELLLYYIKPRESCIMSFASSLENHPSKVFALTEEDTTALLLPVSKVAKWTSQFPDINTLFFHQYGVRYSELLSTINHLLFDKMDKRLCDYLKEKSVLTERNPVKISHRQIASELGTAREVISRVMKKLEHEGHVQQHTGSIEILKW